MIVAQTSARLAGAPGSGTISQYRFLTRNTAGTKVQQATGDRDEIVFGVADRDFEDGQLVSFQDGDIVRVTAGAALDKSDATNYLLTCDSSGRAAVWSPNAGKRLMALWLPDSGDAAVAAGNPVTVRLLLDNEPQPLKGSVTIALGESTATDAVGADYNGKTVLCSPTGGVDATAFAFSGAVAGGTLTITANANATAATDVAYLILD